MHFATASHSQLIGVYGAISIELTLGSDALTDIAINLPPGQPMPGLPGLLKFANLTDDGSVALDLRPHHELITPLPELKTGQYL